MKKNLILQKRSLSVRFGAFRKPKMTEMMRRERMRKVQSLFLGFSGFLLCCVGIYLFFFSPYAEIREVLIVTDPRSISQKELLEVIDFYRQEKVGHIFSRKNFFFFSEKEALKRIENKFLTLKEVSVKKSFPHRVSIDFSERVLSAYWCGTLSCVGIDAEGYVLSQVSYPENLKGGAEKVYPVIIEESSREVSLRDTVLDRQVLSQYQEWENFFRVRLKNQGGILFFIRSPNFEEYRIKTDNKWEIRVARDVPIENTLHSFYVFLETLSPERKEKLESIDLRVEGKIFFTEKGEGSSVETKPLDLGVEGGDTKTWAEDKKKDKE